LRAQRDFAYIHYHIVNRRVRALEEHGFAEKIGQRRTKTGFMATLYQLILRAHLAIVLDKINMDNFIEKAPEAAILSTLEAFVSLS